MECRVDRCHRFPDRCPLACQILSRAIRLLVSIVASIRTLILSHREAIRLETLDIKLETLRRKVVIRWVTWGRKQAIRRAIWASRKIIRLGILGRKQDTRRAIWVSKEIIRWGTRRQTYIRWGACRQCRVAPLCLEARWGLAHALLRSLPKKEFSKLSATGSASCRDEGYRRCKHNLILKMGGGQHRTTMPRLPTLSWSLTVGVYLPKSHCLALSRGSTACWHVARHRRH